MYSSHSPIINISDDFIRCCFTFYSSLSLGRADLTNAALNIEHPTFIPQDRWIDKIKFQIEKATEYTLSGKL